MRSAIGGIAWGDDDEPQSAQAAALGRAQLFALLRERADLGDAPLRALIQTRSS